MPEIFERKFSGDCMLAGEASLPIPIQIFLWKQVSPFIRPKLGKLHEASCVFCQHAMTGHHELKEACKIFEKVLVQNINSGLKPDLTESFKTIPRWKLVQAALPHVMHSAAAVLYNRMKDGNIQSLGAVETKLLYTLHWILLDAAEECADADYEKGIFFASPFYYLFSIPTITVFVYLFAPICQTLKESDFQNFRLENGMKIWQAMWEFRHPDAPCFVSHAKPKPKHMFGRNNKFKTQFGDVFIGRKHSNDDGLTGRDSPGLSQQMSASSSEQHPFAAPNSVTVTATITTKIEDDPGWVSSPKDTVFPETIPEESSSTEEEHVVIFRLPSLHESDGFLRDPSIYTAETSIIQLAMRRNGRTNNVKAEHIAASSGSDTKTTSSTKPPMQKIGSSTDKDSLDSGGKQNEANITDHFGGTKFGSHHIMDLTAATFLDVAVLRCLFITHWQEEGIYWALHFLYNRLRDISEETASQHQTRKRSNSLPIPKIEISLYQSNDNKKIENNKEYIEVPEPKDVSLLAESPYTHQKQSSESLHKRTSSEKKRRMKIADLKAFVETKILSKSDKALEKIGQDEQPKPLGSQVVGSSKILNEYHRSLDTGDEQLSKWKLGMSKIFEPPSNLVKGKSMPSLSCLVDEINSAGFIEENRSDERRISKTTYPTPMTNPIITVTEHTPTPSPDFLKRQGSMDSQLDIASLSGAKLCQWHDRKASLTRSQTDSNITYASEDIPEAAGSACYITKDGDIDFIIVLKAVYKTALRETSSCTVRVLEVILNLLELLMDMGVLKQCLKDEAVSTAASVNEEENCATEKEEDKKLPSSATHTSFGTDGDKVDKPMSSHRLIMSTIFRVLKHLGCPHGCADGQRGPAAEFLRTQCQNILSKLNRASSKQFKKFVKDFIKNTPLTDIIEVFHSYVGFCVDPSSLLSPLTQKKQGCTGTKNQPSTTHGRRQSNVTTSNFGSLGVGCGTIRGVEGHIMSHCLKPLVTRFVQASKEIKSPDNLGLYCDIRQLMTYVKECHGGIFRRVALSALIDTAEKNARKDGNIQTTRVIRHMRQSEVEDQPDAQSDVTYTIDDKGIVRKLLFKKRSTSSTCASLLETEAEDITKSNQSPLGNIRRKHHILTPRQSEKALGIGLEQTSQKNKRSKLGGIVNWFKKGESCSLDELDNPDNGDSFSAETASFIRQSSKLYQQKGGNKSNVQQTIQKAKRRMEDKLKFLKKGKKKDGSIEETAGGYFSRKNSFELGESSRESEFVVLKERKLIHTGTVYTGMQRLSFLLETCPPGSVPDAHLLASALDLPHSAVVARAALLLECSYFVHCCNKGQWPNWMKLSFPIFRPSVPLPPRQGTAHGGIRRTHIMQRSAGKMFHQWGEVIGQRLEEMLNEDKKLNAQISAMVLDPEKQKELQIQDEEEDFLDEASIYTYGTSCPMALRVVACMLLHEITAFLRETYQTLPKSSRVTGKERPPPWERLYSKEANRRWSMALSSMGHSQTSAQSLQSIAGGESVFPGVGQSERKISFVLHEPDNESEGSSNTTVTMQMLQGDESKRQQPRPYLLRRGTAAPGGGSFKRRSLKLRRGTKEGKDMMEVDWRIPESVKRTDSIQSKRKVSSLSDRSDTSEPGAPGEVSGEESPGVLSDDQPPESPSDSNDSDDTTKNMPWLKVMVQVSNSFYYFCNHQNFCHPFCYRRVMRGCGRLIKAVRKVYGEEFGITDDKFISTDETKKKSNKKEKNQNRKVSDQTSSQVSPVKRKDSVGRRDRIDKNFDGSQASKLASKDSSRDIADSDGGNGFSKSTEDGKPTETPPVLKFIKTKVKDSFHAPLATLLKGAVLLSEEHFIEIIPVAWELLLEMNQEVTAAAASLFILAAVKAPTHVSEIMQHNLSHSDVSTRINAILRFQVLWKMRFQVWPRMEENAHFIFKVPPPGIEFTLPSPKIGIECLDVVDSPWELLVKTKVEEVTINQERHRSLVTATKTRKKQQTELIKMALQAQDDKKREERENFLITTIPITTQAAHEPSLFHTGEEHEDDDEQVEGQPRNTGHHLQSAHALFPSCLCSSVLQIINLLDDAAVSADGCSVYEVAYSLIWICLVEDSALFLKYVLERLTREKQDQMFKSLRHLIRFIPKLPQQAAFALYNYIIGYVMFYVRSSHKDGQQLIGAALSLLWMVVHSVHGIMFKDLKQILRKEQCDASILLTANVPSAKKIIVHGPQDPDAGGIPSQFPVQEDTQFCQILREALDFFGIEEEQQKEYFLVDYKTHHIKNPSSYVRDYYFFKRSQYPQLELVYMEPEKALNALQKQELVHKFVEIGKVLLTWAILKNVDMVVQRVVFLHEELMKLPSFPRKALESDLDLYKSGPYGKELLGLDVLHKFMWVRLIARMFEAMAGNFAYSGDIHLFVNVLNGALILHSEDACILRYVMATYINAAFNFKNIFSTNGYLLIMPTLLKIYSNLQTNKLVTTTIEYAVKEFYTMNRKPFILQMFGSVSAMLDTDEEGMYGDAHKIQSSCLFNLLLSLETPSPDPLNIAELVKEPVKAIDFCYHDEDNDVTILDCISMCVMVVSYSSESCRGYQMLVILEAILPYYVEQIQKPVYIANSVKRFKKNERDILHQLSVAIRCLIENCAELTKVYNGPYRSSPEHKGSSQRNYKGTYSPGFDFEDDSHSKFMSEHCRAKTMYEHDTEDSEVMRAEYRRPRDVLLSLVGEFMYKVSERLQEINKKDGDGKILEVLDCRSHVRLAEIAHALLKVSPYDPESMACRGLQYYMSYVLPSTEWCDDTMKPALLTLIKRLEKVFAKIQKKASIRRNTDWDAAAGLLKGLYNTMVKYTYMVHWHNIKQLISVCQSLIVTECCVEGVSGASAALLSQPPPPNFCSMVVRLIALQMQSTQDTCTLETVCGGSVFPSQEKTESMIINLVMPLCLRVGSGRKDLPQMKISDISFAITLILHAMSPPNIKTMTQSGPNPKATAEIRTGSLTFTGTRDTKTSAKINTSLYQVSFLALKMIAICFEQEIVTEWLKIGRAMRELGKRNEAATYLWDFLDFVVTHRTPLYILMQPFIFLKLAQPPISDFERSMHQKIRDKMRSIGLPLPKSKGAILMDLANQMKQLKEELSESPSEATTGSKKDSIQPTVQMTNETSGRQRHSLIGLLTGDIHHQKTMCQDHAHIHPKESSTSTSHDSIPNPRNLPEEPEPHVNNGSSAYDRSSQRSSVSSEHCPKNDSLITHKVHKLRFVSSVEFRNSSGETSTTPLSPASPIEDSSGEVHSKSRLQRMVPQSRKTFRLRSRSRSKKNDVSHVKLESGEFSPPDSTPTSPPYQPDPQYQHFPQPTTTLQQPQDSSTVGNNNLQSNSTSVVNHIQQSIASTTHAQQTTVASIQQAPTMVAGSQPSQISSVLDSHRLRIATRGKSAEGSWDEDSAISQTSSTSGYRESYPVMHLKETLETSPKAFPPLASPDLHSLPSTSSAATNNFLHLDNSSPDVSLNENGEKTALLGKDDKSSSKDSLLMVFEQQGEQEQDETTLI